MLTPDYYAVADGDEVRWLTDAPPAEHAADRAYVDRDEDRVGFWRQRRAAEQEQRQQAARRQKQAGRQKGLTGDLSIRACR